MPLLFAHVQYSIHTHSGHTLAQALVHFIGNEIVQTTLLVSALIALILLTELRQNQ